MSKGKINKYSHIRIKHAVAKTTTKWKNKLAKNICKLQTNKKKANRSIEECTKNTNGKLHRKLKLFLNINEKMFNLIPIKGMQGGIFVSLFLFLSNWQMERNLVT